MGSKAKIAKHIVPIIQSYIDNTNAKFYLEPFVGGANVIDKIRCERRIGYDINHYLIALLSNLDLVSTLPDEISREEYGAVRNAFNAHSDEYPDWYIGAVGFLASYNGRFFDGGYAGVSKPKNGAMRNYYAEAKRNLLVQAPLLQDVEFKEVDYKKINISELENGVIYCDIPYRNTKGYKDKFNHDEFWSWANEVAKNNVVLLSEQEAPPNWIPLWSQPIKRTINSNRIVLATEHLYVLGKTHEERREIMQCQCYATRPKRAYTYSPATGQPIASYDYDVGICNGTKERDECSCEGDTTRCDFYEEKRNRNDRV